MIWNMFSNRQGSVRRKGESWLAGRYAIEWLESRRLLAGVVADYFGQRVEVVDDAIGNAPAIPILVDGVQQDSGDQIVIYHTVSPTDIRQKLVLDSNGLLRLRHSDDDMPPGAEDPFGTSIKLPPGLIINNGSGPEFYLSVRLTEIDVITTSGSRVELIAKGAPMDGAGNILNSVQLQWNIQLLRTLKGETQSLTIQTFFTTVDQVILDPTALANAEAFRSGMFSSSYVPAANTSLGVITHDADQLAISRSASPLTTVDLNSQPANSLFFPGGLTGVDTVSLNQVLPAPLNGDPPSVSIRVKNPGAVKYRAQGFLSTGPGIDENSDNLGVWISREEASNVIPSGRFYAWTLEVLATDIPQLTPKADVVGWDPDSRIISQGGSQSTRTYQLNQSSTWNVVVGDFDGDGFQDIAARHSAGSWWLYGRNFDSSNRSWGSWAPDAAAGWQNVQAVDVNGDGRDDIVGQLQTGQWWAAISTGSRFVNTYMGRWASSGWVTLQAGDYNGDGLADMAGLRGDGTWIIGLAQGGRFRDFHVGHWDGAAGWSNFQVTDLDGDGRQEILAQAAMGAWWIASLEGDANSIQSTYAGRTQGTENLLADFTHDGLPDLAVRLDSGDWWVGANNGTGRMSNFARWGNAPIGDPWHFVTGDYDGNGIIDIGAARDSDNALYILASTTTSFAWTRIGIMNGFHHSSEYFGGDFG